MKAFEKIIFLAGLVLLFGGLNLVILLSHMSRFIGVVFIVAGIGLLLWSVKDAELAVHRKPEMAKNLASKMVNWLTIGGRLKKILPVIGVLIMVAILIFNIVVRDNFYLGSNDFVALFLAGVFLAYNYIPIRYSIERDFAFLFGIFLFIFLVLPTTLLSFGGGEADTNSPLTYYFLAMPTAGFARLLGVPVESPLMDAGTPIYNMMVFDGPDGFPINLSIALSCSGLYSVAIFVSAFIAYVAVEYKKADRKVFVLLIVGISLAWIANIIRMTIVVMVGHYYGADTMEWVHNNIGELIFMAWISLFWMVVFRYFGLFDKHAQPVKKGPPKKGVCAVCGTRLSPTIQSVKCECGKVSHTECIESRGGRCPSCGGTFSVITQGEG